MRMPNKIFMSIRQSTRDFPQDVIFMRHPVIKPILLNFYINSGFYSKLKAIFCKTELRFELRFRLKTRERHFMTLI